MGGKMSVTALELLAVLGQLESGEGVKSLFQAAAVLALEYSWGWRCLGQLEAAGMVSVRRGGRGVPLQIMLTEVGKMVISTQGQQGAAGENINFEGV